MASNEIFKLESDFFSTKKIANLPRCEGFGRRDTLMGVDAPSYESEGEAAERTVNYLERVGRRNQWGGLIEEKEIPTQMT